MAFYSSGNNTRGKLGVGAKEEQLSAFTYSKLKFKNIALGNRHALGIAMNSKLLGWGENLYGQLSSSFTDSIAAPKVIDFFDDIHLVGIDAGDRHSIALHSNGSVWTWGSNSEGQLCSSSTHVDSEPLLLDLNSFGGEKVVRIVAQDFASYFVTNLGHVYMCGLCSEYLCESQTNYTTPHLQQFGVFVESLSIGDDTLFITDNKKNVYAKGRNEHAQLCFDANHSDSLTTDGVRFQASLKRVAINDVDKIAAGTWNTVIQKDMIAYGCGQIVQKPLDTVFADEQLNDVAISAKGVLFLTARKALVSKGFDTAGELGIGVMRKIDNKHTIAIKNYSKIICRHDFTFVFDPASNMSATTIGLVIGGLILGFGISVLIAYLNYPKQKQAVQQRAPIVVEKVVLTSLSETSRLRSDSAIQML